MAEQVAPQVAGNADERVISDPGSDPPQQIVGGNQGAEQAKCSPCRRILAARERIDQELYAVLGADRAAYGCEHRAQNSGMRNRSQTDVAKNERER